MATTTDESCCGKTEWNSGRGADKGHVRVAGAPHFVKDLAGVSAGQARTIVVLNPEGAVVSPLRHAIALQHLCRSVPPYCSLCDLMQPCTAW